MASSSSSESSSKVSKKNYYYDWSIKEVDKLYSTLIDLQKMQQVFNQLITRVEFLEKKLGIIGTDSNALTKAKSINSIPPNGRSEIQGNKKDKILSYEAFPLLLCSLYLLMLCII